MKCLNEGIIHVHANKGSMTERSIAKLWVYEDGSSKLAYPSSINSSDLRRIQDWIRHNIDLIRNEWLSNNRGGDFKRK
jgi:hypothetical protein